MGRALPRSDLRPGRRAAQPPDRAQAGDAVRLGRARAVHDGLVDVDRLRGPLQPARRRRQRPAAAVPRREHPRGRGGGRDRAGVDGRQHRLRDQPRGRAAGAGRVRERRQRGQPPDGARAYLRSRRALLAGLARRPGAAALRHLGDRHRRRVGRVAARGPRGRAPGAREARLEGAQARRPEPGARRAPLRRALRAVPDHPAGRGGRRGGPGLGRRRTSRPAGGWAR